MLVLVSYDVATTEGNGETRLRRVAKICKDYGQRVQFSVFECEVDPALWARMRKRLVECIDEDCDSLRFYFLGSNWKRRIEHVGAKEPLDLDDTLIV